MSHSLQALILTEPIDGALPPAAHPVRLHGALVLLPVTDELFDEAVARYGGEGDSHDEVFWKFSPALCALAVSLVEDRPYAYIETDYFGGVGTQAAGAWKGHEVVMAPVQAEIGPINDVLSQLGVRRGLTQDQFDRVGLSRHRHTEDWLEEPAL